MFFEITNNFLFYFQQGMQYLERSVATRACLAKVSFLAFLWSDIKQKWLLLYACT